MISPTRLSCITVDDSRRAFVLNGLPIEVFPDAATHAAVVATLFNWGAETYADWW